MKVTADFRSKGSYTLGAIAQGCIDSNKGTFGRPFNELMRSISRTSGTQINLENVSLIIVGDRKAILEHIQGLSNNRVFVAAPGEQVFAEYVHRKPSKALAAYGSALLATSIVAGPAMYVGDKIGTAIKTRDVTKLAEAGAGNGIASPKAVAHATASLMKLATTDKFTVLAFVSAEKSIGVPLGPAPKANAVAWTLGNMWNM